MGRRINSKKVKGELQILNLDLFNNLINNTKENNVVQKFIKELGEYMEETLCNNELGKETLLQKILDGKNLTARYRDKINIQKCDIITNYSIQNSEKGEFYYVYSKGEDNRYGVVMHKNEKLGSDIWINKSQLPKGAGVDCVLRQKNGKFVLDKESTYEIQKKLSNMIEDLIIEQDVNLEKYRVEGHIYKLLGKTEETIELIDITANTGECFEEIYFPKEILDKAISGTILQYVDGKYQLKN